jgi:hypothetical protein
MVNMRLTIVAAALLTMAAVSSPAEAEDTCAAHQPGKAELQSRYQSVATLGLCPGQDKAGAQITWAWCLGKTCDWADSGTTTCHCDETNSKAQSSLQYLLVTPLTATNCSDRRIHSSATLDQIFAATSLLRCNGISTFDPKVQWIVTGP